MKNSFFECETHLTCQDACFPINLPLPACESEFRFTFLRYTLFPAHQQASSLAPQYRGRAASTLMDEKNFTHSNNLSL